MKRKFLLLFLAILVYDLYAQQRSVLGNFVYADYTRLMKVSFGGLGIIDIYKDDISPAKPEIHSRTAWLDTTGSLSPIGYISGNKPAIKALFKLCKEPVWVMAKGLDNHQFKAQKLINTKDGSLYPLTVSNISFEKNRVKYYDPFEITWYMSQDSVNFVEIGKSVNRLYVTYDKPKGVLSNPISSNVYHTVIHYGCKSANNLKDSIAIVQAIYQKTFIETKRKIKRIDNPYFPEMLYWGGTTPLDTSDFRFTADALIYYEDATCGAWADFFKRLIINQGIGNIHTMILTVDWGHDEGEILPDSLLQEMRVDFSKKFKNNVKVNTFNQPSYYSKLFVNNWSFPTLKEFYTDAIDLKIETSDSSFFEVAASDLIGIPAQGNINPKSDFQNHGLVEYRNLLYDPSYGTSSAVTPTVWENSALKAFGTSIWIDYKDFNTHTQKTNRIHWVRKYNTPIRQVFIAQDNRN